MHDLDKGRRYGTIEDFQNNVKLAYLSPYIHHSGGGTVCEPVDLPVNKRWSMRTCAIPTKPSWARRQSPNAADTVAMCELLIGAEFVANHTVCTSLINVNSPPVWDSTLLGGAGAYARANQACVITPFILSGAMSPAPSPAR